MSNQDIRPIKYSELRSVIQYHIDSYNALYQLKIDREEDLNSIYKMIKTELIDSKKHPPENIIKDILNIIEYNNRYTKSYLKLAKLISDDYHVTDVSNITNLSNYLFYEEYGINLDKTKKFETINIQNLKIHSEDTIFRAIMDNDLEKFIAFTERQGFDKDQKLKSNLYPYSSWGHSLLELCCYHGAVDCFKFLRTEFKSAITDTCLKFSFLGRSKENLSECLKYLKPNEFCMRYAIISHNIDFVTFLMNEYSLYIDLEYCAEHNNIESFLVYFDQTNDVDKCFVYSPMFNIPSFCEYFLSRCKYINTRVNGLTALHSTTWNNCKEIAELLISHGAYVDVKDNNKKTALHYAALNNSKEIVELLISHGSDINEKDNSGKTALHYAAQKDYKEIVEILISHGADINEKDNSGKISLHYAAWNNCKETVELLISHGANINEKDEDGKIALHYAAQKDYKEIVEVLISHGTNINEKDNSGETALHYAECNRCRKTAEVLISHGANSSDCKNKDIFCLI
ncbi:protein ubiquitination [Trichomonas vaginalis G3]|uniref:protein ubiquitination n=1 Tax=Trichomonas vaginalis (strain ATCC PRA-98 / G3) TaxID=412133 RepID=UPI0021E5401C|nr:protein ubiquitination [Trichomonas vaginalis G3]KAI5500068.1 protein ubiquitination [Trichomonas vaginalis G3]